MGRKQRPSVQKRDREQQKRQREVKKAAKAAEKRERGTSGAESAAISPDAASGMDETPGADGT